MENKISVIVPIYNVELYLDRCIESLVNQTYTNIEIILINDGCTDRCPEICEKWKNKDSRIMVIHKMNGGLSDARNVGVKWASGEFVAFVDSDDWIHKDMLKLLLETSNQLDADIVECRAISTCEYMEDKELDRSRITAKSYSRDCAIQVLINEDPLKQTVWNKLYKREVIGDIDFEIGKYHEDEFWTYQIFAKANKVIFIDEKLYYYFQRENSIMGQAFSLKRLDAVEGRLRRLHYIRKNYPVLELSAKENLFFLIVFLGQQALLSKLKNESVIYFKSIKSYMREIRFSKEENAQLTFTHRIWIWLGEKSLRNICWIRNKLGIGIK